MSRQVPRCILPDYMVRMHKEEIKKELESNSHDKELEDMRIRCKEHLNFQEKLREAHLKSGPVSALAIAHHGPDPLSDHAHAGLAAGGRVIPAQPDQLIGDMGHAIDKDIRLSPGEVRAPIVYKELPGKSMRPEDLDATGKLVYANALAVYQYYREVHNRDSLNNRHLKLISSIHFGNQYANAFWSSPDLQMVYGDGAPGILENIAHALDVAGHEMTHGIIDQEGGLDYQDESGALNESIADVFGILVKQWKNKHSVSQSDWLIGPGIVPTWGKALRSFTSESVNKYDIQPKTYEGIEKWLKAHADAVRRDYGGVHQLSGIPNHAFYRFSMNFKDANYHAYDGLPAKIWYGVVVGRKIRSDATFHEFAQLTVEKARELGGEEVANKLIQAWADVAIYLDEGRRLARKPVG